MHTAGPDLHVINCDADPGIECPLDEIDNCLVINSNYNFVNSITEIAKRNVKNLNEFDNS